MIFKNVLIFSILISSFAIFAKENKKPKIIRKEMNTISTHVRELAPYIASETEFIKDGNKKLVLTHLEELTQLFKELKVHPIIEMQGLSLNRKIMSDQLDQTISLYKGDKKREARNKFNAALNLCVSCHTQSPGIKAPKLFSDKDIKNLKLSDYEKAELYFITRDFDKAIATYDLFLSKTKKTDDDEFVSKALERELIYYIKMRRSFLEAKNKFEKLLKNNKFNANVTREIKEWIVALSAKTLWENYDPAKVTDAEMEKFMSTFISDEEEGPIFTLSNSSEVSDLNLSSILLDYYNAHPETKHGAKILYWLAILDKRINDELFFSLGDYYLLQCMEKYSKDPVSKDCYEAYLEEMEFNYLSKGQKDFPIEVKEKLKTLEKIVGEKIE